MQINCQGRLLSLDKPLVMGILNVTDNSFYDGGRYVSDAQVLQRVEQMVAEGAAIADVGAVSTHPGAPDVPEKDELQKICSTVSLIRKHYPELLLSVDTWRASVAEASVLSGANIINDISGGLFDEAMIPTVARLRAPYILMHTTAKPATMQQELVGSDLLQQILTFFAKQVEQLKALGAHDIILDPGLGFGKTLEQNYQLLHQMSAFQVFQLPILIGASRKSMIYKLLGSTPADALNGTTAVNVLALLNGAAILRVHDVRAAVEAVKIVDMYQHTHPSL